jgi:hypothetical protein
VKAQDPHTEAAASGRHIRDLGSFFLMGDGVIFVKDKVR